MTGQKSDSIFEQKIATTPDHGLKQLARYHRVNFEMALGREEEHDTRFYERRTERYRNRLHIIAKEQKRRFDNITNNPQ